MDEENAIKPPDSQKILGENSAIKQKLFEAQESAKNESNACANIAHQQSPNNNCTASNSLTVRTDQIPLPPQTLPFFTDFSMTINSNQNETSPALTNVPNWTMPSDALQMQNIGHLSETKCPENQQLNEGKSTSTCSATGSQPSNMLELASPKKWVTGPIFGRKQEHFFEVEKQVTRKIATCVTGRGARSIQVPFDATQPNRCITCQKYFQNHFSMRQHFQDVCPMPLF